MYNRVYSTMSNSKFSVKDLDRVRSNNFLYVKVYNYA